MSKLKLKRYDLEAVDKLKAMFAFHEMDPKEVESRYIGMKALYDARNEFVKEYAKEKGWVLDDMTFQKFCEIKGKKGWIKPEGIENV